MVLKHLSSIKRPTGQFVLDNNKEDLEVQITSYYRCLDTLEYKDNEDNENNINEEGDDDNLFSKEKQKELSYTQPLLIKAYGILESGHSITINLRNFQPFYYIKIPDHWDRKQ